MNNWQSGHGTLEALVPATLANSRFVESVTNIMLLLSRNQIWPFQGDLEGGGLQGELMGHSFPVKQELEAAKHKGNDAWTKRKMNHSSSLVV